MEKFYPVQIPYRGIIPMINKRGPLARVELQESMIRDLQGMGVEMLNPDNGQPFVFPEPTKLAGGMDLQPVTVTGPVIGEVKEPEHVEEPDETPAADPEEPAAEPEKEAEPAPAVEVTAEPEAEAEDDGEDEEIQIDPNSGAVMMDGAKVPGYDALSRNKQKAVRRRFREAYAESKDINIAYAEATAAVTKVTGEAN